MERRARSGPARRACTAIAVATALWLTAGCSDDGDEEPPAVTDESGATATTPAPTVAPREVDPPVTVAAIAGYTLGDLEAVTAAFPNDCCEIPRSVWSDGTTIVSVQVFRTGSVDPALELDLDELEDAPQSLRPSSTGAGWESSYELGPTPGVVQLWIYLPDELARNRAGSVVEAVRRNLDRDHLNLTEAPVLSSFDALGGTVAVGEHPAEAGARITFALTGNGQTVTATLGAYPLGETQVELPVELLTPLITGRTDVEGRAALLFPATESAIGDDQPGRAVWTHEATVFSLSVPGADEALLRALVAAIEPA